MADKKTDERTVQDINFDNARKTAQINHDNSVENTVGGYEGVEVRPLNAVEVINPVRNSVTGELQDDTRVIKQSDAEVVGATGDHGDEGDKDA